MKEARELSTLPVVEAIRDNTRSFLVSAGLKVSENAWVYILTVFIVLYATSFLKLPRQTIVDAFLYAAVVEFIIIPIFGYLSDKIGRRPLYFFGSLFTIAFVFPLFWLIVQFAAALAGSFSPIVSTSILGFTGSTTGISLYMMGLVLITLIATFFAHETVGNWISE